MNSSPEQPDATGAETLEQSKLAQRLVRRRTEPVGVIDVRQPQQLYTRTAGWVAQRFALLDRWRARYGSGEQATSVGGDLVLTPQFSSLAEFGGASPYDSPASRHIVTTPSNLPADTGTPPAPLLRVSRRSPAAAVMARAVDPASAPAEAKKTGIVENTDRSQPGSQPGFTVASSESPLILLHRAVERIEVAPERSTGESKSEPGALRAIESVAPAQREQAIGGRGDLRQEEAGPAESASSVMLAMPPKLARSREISRPTPHSADARVLRIGALPDSPVPQPGSIANTTVTLARMGMSAATRQSESAVERMTPGEPLLPTVPAAQAVQRQPDVVSRQLEVVSREEEMPIALTTLAAGRRQSAVVAEVSGGQASISRAHMIWRQSAGGMTSGDYPVTGRSGYPTSPLPLKIEAAPVNGPVTTIARQIGDGSAAGSGTAPNMTPLSTESTASTREIDVPRLAEQVGRLLSRQLAVERERRGMK